MNERWKPSVTVAAVVAQEGRYLLVEEHTPEGLRLNNPAGHLDAGEGLVEACVRETLEETAYRLQPEALVGVYLSRFQRAGATEPITYLRFAITGSVEGPLAGQALDTGIVRALWLTPEEVRASQDRHRSPLVLRCMEDHLAGQRHPLSLIHTDLAIWQAR